MPATARRGKIALQLQFLAAFGRDAGGRTGFDGGKITIAVYR